MQTKSLPDVITIDGGAGTGTSTQCTKIAARLGYLKLNSGAFYRVIGVIATRRGVALNDTQKLVAIATTMDIAFVGDNVFLNGKDETVTIFSDDAGRYASIVAQIPEVRAMLKIKQLAMRKAPGLVADGRDMGKVFDTPYRFFITTAPEERARRRVAQFKLRGVEKSYDEVFAEIIRRDESDRTNVASPLAPHPDAILIINNTLLTADNVTDIIITTYHALKQQR